MSAPLRGNYLSTLSLLPEPSSGNESSDDEFKSVIAWSRLPDHSSARLFNSIHYRRVSVRLPKLVDQVEYWINYYIPDSLFEVSKLFHRGNYRRAQTKLLDIIETLARSRLIFRVVNRVSRAGRFREHRQEILQLQSLYRLNHTTAYAFSQLLRIRLLPPLEEYRIATVKVSEESSSE